MKLIQLHKLHDSPLFPIFRSLSCSLHGHSSVAQGTPSIQPNLGLPRTRPALTTAIKTIMAIFKNVHFPSLSTSHTPCLWSFGTITPSYTLLGLYPQSIYCSVDFLALPKLSMYHISFTSSISCHLRQEVHKTIHTSFNGWPFSITSHAFDPHFYTSST